MVVKVLDTTMTSVVSARSPCSALATSTGSTFARKRSFLAGAQGRHADQSQATEALEEGGPEPSLHSTPDPLGAPALSLLLALVVEGERGVDEGRSQVAAADADGHHVLQLLAGGAPPLPTPHAFCRFG